MEPYYYKTHIINVIYHDVKTLIKIIKRIKKNICISQKNDVIL